MAYRDEVTSMKRERTLTFMVLILGMALLCSMVTSDGHAASMTDYCQTPPFIIGGVKPNLLLMLDNSASMYDLAHISDTGTYCYDNTYSDAKSYGGYFSQSSMYTYDFFTNRFALTSFIPMSCTYATGYLCVNVSGGAVNQFTARGNFLNWLSASKFDIEKKILTGGKYDSANKALVGESRGCVGRRFIKELPAVPNLTFAVRGPNAIEDGNLNPDTQGGQTRIEIYQANFNEGPCIEAVEAWDDDPLGTVSTLTRQCLGLSGGAGTARGRELASAVEAIRDCWFIKENIENGESDILRNVTIQNLEIQCSLVYTRDCDPGNIKECETLSDEESGNYACSAAAEHILVPKPYNLLGNDQEGFLGRCWEGSGWSGEDCTSRELLHFCQGVNTAEVIDPSAGPTETTGVSSIPAFMMDAGIRAIGDPVGVFPLVVDTPSAPNGILQDYGGQIRLGAMSFNELGSPSECDQPGTSISCKKVCSVTFSKTCTSNADCPVGETCVNLDGGKIIHDVGDPVGTHASGLVHEVSSLAASTWTPYSEAFFSSIGYFANRSDLRVNQTDFLCSNTDGDSFCDANTASDTNNNRHPVQYRCQRNNILIISDGMSTADWNSRVTTFVNSRPGSTNDGDGQVDSSLNLHCKEQFAGTVNLDDLSYFAHNFKISDTTNSAPPKDPTDTITTYVVYTGTDSREASECNPRVLMQETAENGGTTLRSPSASDESGLRAALEDAFQNIAAKSASGTAASVLASGEGSGANLVQAVFYPVRQLPDGTELSWTGVMQNFWYYIDPFFGNSTIREDTEPQDSVLKLTQDRIVLFDLTSSGETVVKLFEDANGDGAPDSTVPAAVKPFDQTDFLWEAGGKLFTRDPATRTIYVNLSNSLSPFVTGNAIAMRQMLGVSTDAEASKLIRYVRGTDNLDGDGSFGDANRDGINDDAGDSIEGIAVRNRTATIPDLKLSASTWKLGDIVNSTPKIVSWVPLNLYTRTYNDATYTQFTESPTYKNRGVVFVGANDGMLHAFRLGTLKLYREMDRKASLEGTGLGEELWAFVPRHLLPYLKYLARPDYCHLYYIDATPVTFDASIGIDSAISQPTECTGTSYYNCTKTAQSWRTVLIGSMRTGGACRKASTSCTECVKTPMDDPADATKGLGYSSYFALDITNPAAPSLLWEISGEELGYSTSGPAVVRIGDKAKNGRWFVVFGSGPSGYVNPSTHQITGVAEHLARGDINLFVHDLKTGALLRTINAGEYSAYTGSLVNSTIDVDRDYQDDAVYFGYSVRAPLGATYTAAGGTVNTIQLAASEPAVDGFYKGYYVHRNDSRHETKLIVAYDGATRTATVDSNWADPVPTGATTYNILTGWNDGGVKKLLTKESMDPNLWVVQPFVSGTGPISASVSFLQDYSKHKLWVFFASGRYFYKTDDIIDDSIDQLNGSVPFSQRRLFGVKDPCYYAAGADEIDSTSCSATYSAASLTDSSGLPSSPAIPTAEVPTGWRIDLDRSTTDTKLERVITNPLSTPFGAVFFTTTMPSSDICSYGGQSGLWSVCYLTGGPLGESGPCKVLPVGKGLLQVSTGEIKQIDLKTSFTERGMRRTPRIQGVPPTGSGLSVLIAPDPSRKFIFKKEQ